jgi:hypothetical protein
MGRKYTQGMTTPKGIVMTTAEPVDQRVVVNYLVDLYEISLNAYPGIKVTVLEEIEGDTLNEYKLIGSDSTNPSNWLLWGNATGSGGGAPSTPNQYTSFVFLRNVGNPATPTGGDYDTPTPAGWFDYVPAGTDPLWMSSGIMIDGAGSPTWTTPTLTEDNANIDYQYCVTGDVPIGDIVNGVPLEPLESPVQRTYWHDEPEAAVDDWMAIGQKIGGNYPTAWQVVRIGGENGATGPTGQEGRQYVTSTVFSRSNEASMNRAVVSGGGFNSPSPTLTTIDGITQAVSWSDGIPDGTAKIWMSSFVFNSVDNASSSPANIWTVPGPMSDTATVDFEFSSLASTPGTPDTNPSGWTSTADSSTIWIAQRTVSNGTLGAWQVWKAKGETGETGAGIQIAGRDTIANILLMTTPAVALMDIWIASDTDAGADVPGVVNDAYLYVGAGNGTNGTEWDNIGSVVGTDGVSYKYSVIFKREATIPTTPTGGTFDDPVAAGWSDAPPAAVNGTVLWMSTRYFANDPTINAALEDWSLPALAADTNDFTFQYALEQGGGAAPALPDVAAPGIWFETGTADSVWMAKASKLNGVIDDTSWILLRIQGEQGATGSDGIPAYLSSAYIKTNNDISGLSVTGGTYVSPIPTSLYSGVNWTDGIPSGDGALWFVQVKFDQTDVANDKVWPAPTKMADNATVEYLYSSSVSEPVGDPIEGSPGGNTWYDNASDVTDLSQVVRWMAIGSRYNGIWPTAWDKVSVIGETGAAGLSPRTYIPSSLFVRSDDENIQSFQPTGQYLVDNAGEFEITGAQPTSTVGPYTYTFVDGIPDRTGSAPGNALKVWMIQAVFNSVDHLGIGNQMTWSYPTLLADNNTIDYEYHPGIGVDHTIPGDPGSGQLGWLAAPDADTYWIAQKNWAEGPSAVWVVYLIRGEDGAQGAPPATVFSVLKLSQAFDTAKDAANATSFTSNQLKYHNGVEDGAAATGNDVFNTAVDGDLYDGTFLYYRRIGEISAVLTDEIYQIDETGTIVAQFSASELTYVYDPIVTREQIIDFDGTWTESTYTVAHFFGHVDKIYTAFISLKSKSTQSIGGRTYVVGERVTVPFQHNSENNDLRGCQVSWTDSQVKVSTTTLKIFDNDNHDGDNGQTVNPAQFSLHVTLLGRYPKDIHDE